MWHCKGQNGIVVSLGSGAHQNWRNLKLMLPVERPQTSLNLPEPEIFFFFFFYWEVTFFHSFFLFCHRHSSESNCPPIWYARVLSSMNVTLFGNGVFADVIKWRWDHPGLEYDWLESLQEEGEGDLGTGAQRKQGRFDWVSAFIKES